MNNSIILTLWHSLRPALILVPPELDAGTLADSLFLAAELVSTVIGACRVAALLKETMPTAVLFLRNASMYILTD